MEPQSPLKRQCGNLSRYGIDHARRNDPDHVLECVRQDENQMKFMANNLRLDTNFNLQLLRANPKAIMSVHTTLKESDEFMLKAMRIDVNFLAAMSKELQSSYSFFEHAFQHDVNALCFASTSVLEDFDIADHMDSNSTSYISDKAELLRILAHVKNGLMITPKTLNEDKEVVLAAMVNGMDEEDYACPILWCSQELFKDKGFVADMLVKAPSNAGSILHMYEGKPLSAKFFRRACKRNMELLETLPNYVLVKMARAFVNELG